jgi:hypothetical protein
MPCRIFPPLSIFLPPLLMCLFIPPSLSQLPAPPPSLDLGFLFPVFRADDLSLDASGQNRLVGALIAIDEVQPLLT